MRSFILPLVICALTFLGAYHSFALKPSKTYEVIPDTLHRPFEKNTIITADGMHLRSWTFLPAKDADNKTTLVLAYADAGNMSWWVSYAAIMSQVGYTVVMFDYRGFGESDDFTVNPDMLYYNEFVTDLSAAVLLLPHSRHIRLSLILSLVIHTSPARRR